MRRIEYTNQFKRDYKRQSKGPHAVSFESEFRDIVNALACDEPLQPRHRDHALTGDWKDHRDCHVKPDVVLIYRKPNNEALQLVRLGSHSTLSL